MSKKQIKVGSKVWVYFSEVPHEIIVIGVTQYVVSVLGKNGTGQSESFYALDKEQVFATKAERKKFIIKHHANVGDYVMCINYGEKHCGLVVKAGLSRLTVLLDEEPTKAYVFHKDRDGFVRFPKNEAVVLVKATKK